jgi:hypothetical protein
MGVTWFTFDYYRNLYVFNQVFQAIDVKKGRNASKRKEQ